MKIFKKANNEISGTGSETLNFGEIGETIGYVGNYEIRLSSSEFINGIDFETDQYQHVYDCEPNVEVLLPLVMTINSDAEKEYRNYDFHLSTPSFRLIFNNKPIVYIDDEIENNDEIRFKYMMQCGVNIIDVQFMSLREFAKKFFELLRRKR